MKLYLDKPVESIPIFNNLIILLKGYLANPKAMEQYKSIEDIYRTQHLYDPVNEFIEYYSQSSGVEISDGRKHYMINSLYMAKGAPRIFDIYEELFETHIKYIYTFPVLNIVEFDTLSSDNVTIFIEKFKNMLYYLLYFTSIKIFIKNLIIAVKGDLLQYTGGLSFNYILHTFELDPTADNYEDQSTFVI